MKNRLRALVQFDILVPSMIVLAALFVTFEPRVFGVQIADRQIILLLFALLALDSIIERSGRLYRMERQLSRVEQHLTGRLSASAALRTRTSFPRVDAIIKDARRKVLIVGVNLEAAVVALPTIIDLAKCGTEVTLLAMDPDGSSLRSSARMSGVVEDIRQQKIRQNLNLIKSELTSQLSVPARRKCAVKVVDRVFPVGAIGVDVDSRKGMLIVQHYLTATPAERAPLLELTRELDGKWYERYLDQCTACLDGAREW